MLECPFMRQRVPIVLIWTVLLVGVSLARAEPSALPSPSPTPEVPPAQAAAGGEPAPTPPADCSLRALDEAERTTLLRLAWRTLNGHLTHQPIQDADLEAFSLTPCLLAP